MLGVGGNAVSLGCYSSIIFRWHAVFLERRVACVHRAEGRLAWSMSWCRTWRSDEFGARRSGCAAWTPLPNTAMHPIQLTLLTPFAAPCSLTSFSARRTRVASTRRILLWRGVRSYGDQPSGPHACRTLPSGRRYTPNTPIWS
jgi:hypothetical protein